MPCAIDMSCQRVDEAAGVGGAMAGCKSIIIAEIWGHGYDGWWVEVETKGEILEFDIPWLLLQMCGFL